MYLILVLSFFRITIFIITFIKECTQFHRFNSPMRCCYLCVTAVKWISDTLGQGHPVTFRLGQNKNQDHLTMELTVLSTQFCGHHKKFFTCFMLMVTSVAQLNTNNLGNTIFSNFLNFGSSEIFLMIFLVLNYFFNAFKICF